MSATPAGGTGTAAPAADQAVNAAREILAEMGLHLDPCCSGTRLIARRPNGRYLLTVYVEDGCYVLFISLKPLNSDKVVGRYPLADPTCYDRMNTAIRREITR